MNISQSGGEKLKFKKFNYKKIKLKKILILVFFLIMSTFAWFTYRKILDPYFKMHINTWDIEYYVMEGEEKVYFEEEDEDGNITQTPISVSLSEIYPGMEEQTKTVYIENNGEVNSSIKSILSSLTAFGTEYTIVDEADYVANENKAYLSYSEDDNKYTIISDLPFSITITQPEAVNAKQTVTTNISVNWIFDGDDDVDSEWGHTVTIWNQNPNNTYPLNIEISLDFSQIINTTTEGSEGTTEEGTGAATSEPVSESGT